LTEGKALAKPLFTLVSFDSADSAKEMRMRVSRGWRVGGYNILRCKLVRSSSPARVKTASDQGQGRRGRKKEHAGNRKGAAWGC